MKAPPWPGASEGFQSSADGWALPLAVGAVVSIPLGIAALVVTSIGIGLVVTVLVAVVVAWGIRARASAVCAWAFDARPADPGDWPGVENLISGLAVSMGVEPPKFWFTEGDEVNVAVYGMRKGDFHLVVTAGFIAKCARLEQEALLAHALAHLRAGHGPANTVRAVVAGLILPTSRWGKLGSERLAAERQADAWAMSVTRYPPAMIAGLGKVAANGRSGAGADRRANVAAWLWEGSAVAEVDSIPQRIATITEF